MAQRHPAARRAHAGGGGARAAAQNLYAPLRTVEPWPASAASICALALDTLLPTLPVRAGAGRCGGSKTSG
jgi:hypothetical protein